MKQKRLFLMCGPAGCGKTTWVKKEIAQAKVPCVHISRDAVRAQFWKDDSDDYFAYEDQVFAEFCRQIKEVLQEVNPAEAIFVDATHLSEKARNKVLNTLDLTNVELNAVSFEVPLEQVLAQNELRKDQGRAYVPRSVIRRMYDSYRPPTNKEKYKYNRILHIREK